MKYQEWKNQIKPEKQLRTYQHLDGPIDLSDEKGFERVIKTINDIKDHQFLPFIIRSETKIRFRKNNNGKLRRSLKIRPIMYASHMDAHIYSYYNFLLQEEYEKYLINNEISENVTAYRKIKIADTDKGKSNLHHAKEVFDYIKKQISCVVITQDIEGFFDNIDHTILKDMICNIKNSNKLDDSFYKVFRSLTAFRYIEYEDFLSKKIKSKIKNNKYAIYNTLKGLVHENKKNKAIPQGSPISGLLANIYLIEFDTSLKKNFPDVFYRRYSDDLVFVCEVKQKDQLLSFIERAIEKLKLQISAQKSFVTYFETFNGNLKCQKVTNGINEEKNRNYIDYLGLEFSGENTFLRKNTIQKLKHRQIKKVRKQSLNNIKPIRVSHKRNSLVKLKNRNNYLGKAIEVFNEKSTSKQILKVVKDRNRIKKSINKL